MMKTSDEKNRIFQDMQQYPEKYTDEQIEALMDEIDQEPDVNAAWNEFCDKNNLEADIQVTNNQTAKHNLRRWWPAVASVVVIALCAVGLNTNTKNENPVGGVGVYDTDVDTQNAPVCIDPLETGKKQNKEIFAPENKLTAQNDVPAKPMATSEDDKSSQAGTNNLILAHNNGASPISSIRIRGNGGPDKDPVFIVNGHQIKKEALDFIDPEHIANLKVLKDDEAKAKYANLGEQIKNGVIEISLKPEATNLYAELWQPQKDDDKVYACGEKSPSFPGGQDSLRAFIHQNTKYPDVAKNAAVKGRLIMQFVVEKDGSLSDIKLMRSMLKDTNGEPADSTVINACCDEALRVLKLMPRWEPGGYYGDNGFVVLRTHYCMPFLFSDLVEKEIRIR